MVALFHKCLYMFVTSGEGDIILEPCDKGKKVNMTLSLGSEGMLFYMYLIVIYDLILGIQFIVF